MIRPESKVMAQRYARRLCVKRLVRKMRKYGTVLFQATVVHNPDDFTERAAVDEAIREERRK